MTQQGGTSSKLNPRSGEAAASEASHPAEGVSSLPLHVLVARALGWTCIEKGGYHSEQWVGLAPDGTGPRAISDYTTDWERAGPIIERLMRDHRLTLRVANEYEYTSSDVPYFVAEVPPTAMFHGYGETPLLAICILILRLGELGRLPDV